MSYKNMTAIFGLLSMICIVIAGFMVQPPLGMFALGLAFWLLSRGAYEKHKEEEAE